LVAAIFAAVVATDLSQGRAMWLARIEASQAMEIVLRVLLSAIIFGTAWPDKFGMIGMVIIVVGMIWHSLSSPLRQENSLLKSNVMG
jgi:uncharacterized membrane protein